MTRIAVGGFLHETSTFAPIKPTCDNLVHGGGWPFMMLGAAAPKIMRRIKPNGPAFVPPHKSRSSSSATG